MKNEDSELNAALLRTVRREERGARKERLWQAMLALAPVSQGVAQNSSLVERAKDLVKRWEEAE